jgi:hypothetical protein
MVPFSALPMPAAVLAWYGVSIAALIWAGYRLVRLCDSLAGRLVGPVTVLAFAVNAGPIVSGLQRGQTASILFAMLVEAFWQYRAQRSARAGAWIAAATALKLYPALVLLPMVLRRDWRGLAGFAVTLLALGAVLPVIVMGPTHGMTALEAFTSQIVLPFFFKTSYADQAVFSEFNQFAPGNQSVFSFLSHWLAPHALPASDSISLAVADLPVSTVRYIAMAISLGLFVLMVLAIRTNPPRTSIREALLWCLPLVAANFISHIAWSHYYAVLAMPYAIAGVIVVTRPADIAWRLVAVTLVFAVLTNWAYMAALACREAGLLLVGSFVLWIGIAVACLLRRPTVTTATSLAMPPT